ncbi:MAG: VWA domain-containing protein [Gammaproteobacteria bacterium]|nr:VWA domain-containing protein [Gammaproteobacteria bacterium]
MRIPDRETAVFSTSAIDLFASALGAFILLVMLLFPYYRHAGPDDSFSRTQDIMEKRRLASGQLQDLKTRQEDLQSELDQLTQTNQGREQQISRLRKQLMDINNQLAAIPVRITEQVETITPEEPKALTAGVEFSILGLATQAKSFVIVVDMSGSMLQYEKLMIESVLEILKPLNETNQFAIVGYHGNPQPVLWSFPNGNNLVPATKENLELARSFTQSLVRKFVGSTPTHFALQAALEYPASSVILMSDGEPNSPPGFIIENVTQINQFRRTEIHTVAIGQYTHNRNLVLFMQTLARLNDGDFVGVSK